MKKLLLFVFLASTSLIFISWIYNAPIKGDGWSQTEQKAFMKSCTAELKNTPSIDAEGYCGCMLKKIMKKYPDPSDAVNIDKKWMEKEATKCLGVKSKKKKPAPWSQGEQDAFLNSCISEASKNEGINANEYCNCMLDKIMDKYPDPAKVGDIDQDWMTKEAAKCLGM